MSDGGKLNSPHTSLKCSMNFSHSSMVMPSHLCATSIGRPVYRCGPPVRLQTICTTRNLKPQRCACSCHFLTALLAFRVSLAIHTSIHLSTNDETPKTPPQRA